MLFKKTFLGRKGAKSVISLKSSFFLSKFLIFNTYNIPSCKHIRLSFSLFEKEGVLRTKGIILLIDFLEQLTGQRSFLKNVNLLVGKGIWVRGQVDLRGFHFMRFINFFNEFFLSHPLLRFSTRLPFLKVVNKNYVKMIISEIDFFFDAFTRRSLPYFKFYWLELDFFFEENFQLPKNISLQFYTQFFFSHNLFEWRKI